MDAATLNLPQFEKQFNKPATSGRLWRERIACLNGGTHVIEAHWYELSYEDRLRLAQLVDEHDAKFPMPGNFGEWLALLVRGPIAIAWSMLNGDNYPTSYAFALAGFIVALRRRLDEEQAEDARQWAQAVGDDPEFEAAVLAGREALARREYVPVDWTSLRRISA